MPTSDPRRPLSVSPWTLWYSDTFDRDSEPSVEETGERFVDGLSTLWQHALLEGIDEAGNATFSSFWLAWGASTAERADAAVQPFANTTHARLRAWLLSSEAARDAVLRRLALWHYDLLRHSPRWQASAVAVGEEARQMLAAVVEMADLDTFLREP